MKVVVGSFQGSLLNIDSVRQEKEEGRGGGEEGRVLGSTI